MLFILPSLGLGQRTENSRVIIMILILNVHAGDREVSGEDEREQSDEAGHHPPRAQVESYFIT